VNSNGENSISARDCAKKPASFFVAQAFTPGEARRGIFSSPVYRACVPFWQFLSFLEC
jgi:hypothetical protein